MSWQPFGPSPCPGLTALPAEDLLGAGEEGRAPTPPTSKPPGTEGAPGRVTSADVCTRRPRGLGSNTGAPGQETGGRGSPEAGPSKATASSSGRGPWG